MPRFNAAAEVTSLRNQLAQALERIAKLEEQARVARGPRKLELGLPVEVRKAYFAAHPDAKTASPQDIAEWHAGTAN